MTDDNSYELLLQVHLDPMLYAKIEDKLAETWEGVPGTQPTVREVLDEALDNVGRDILDDLDDQERCERVDTCQAQAMVKRALAEALQGGWS